MENIRSREDHDRREGNDKQGRPRGERSKIAEAQEDEEAAKQLRKTKKAAWKTQNTQKRETEPKNQRFEG